MWYTTIYTDGACRGNGRARNKGAWAAWLTTHNDAGESRELMLSKGTRDTTNQAMELTAVVAGLAGLKKPTPVTVVTDSRWVIDGATKWIPKWIARGWKKADGREPKHLELWAALNDLLNIHDVRFRHVRGHTGNTGNEKADAECNRVMDNM